MTHKSQPASPSSKLDQSVEPAPDSAPFPTPAATDAEASLGPLVGLKTPIIGIGAPAGGLEALALDQQANAAGVILSGMGSDGTLGLRALKEKAGGVFVQTPEAATFDAMPRNVVDSGLADVVASAEQLPEKIMA